MVKISGSPVRTASWPTSSPGWVMNRQVSSSESIFRWYTWSIPETTKQILTSWRRWKELNEIPRGSKSSYPSESTIMTDLLSRKLPIVFEQLGDKIRHDSELLKAGYEYLKLSSHNIEKCVSLCMVMKNEGCISKISSHNNRTADGDNGVIAAAWRGTWQFSRAGGSGIVLELPLVCLYKLVYFYSIMAKESRYILNTLCYKQTTVNFCCIEGKLLHCNWVTLLKVPSLHLSLGKMDEQFSRPSHKGR